jgi:hypothetical protein
MRINARMLKNIIDVNHWQYSNQTRVSEGQANDVYIQLVDLDWSVKDTQENLSAFTQFPIRYISPASVISVKATFLSLDDDQEFEVIATQPFVNDGSIFKFALTSVQVPSVGNLKITVTEDSVDKVFIIKQAIVVDLLEQGDC